VSLIGYYSIVSILNEYRASLAEWRRP